MEHIKLFNYFTTTLQLMGIVFEPIEDKMMSLGQAKCVYVLIPYHIAELSDEARFCVVMVANLP
jgi:hypothetical protein